MTQAAPTNLVYAQATQILSDLKKDYASNKNKTPDEIIKIINNTLTSFNSSVNRTLTQFEPLSFGEPPRSVKSNRFLKNVQADMNILQDQIDILNASTVFTHNFIKTEILKAKNENLTLQNKLKILEIYSNVDNDSIVYFGDSFVNEDNIDWEDLKLSDRAAILASGYACLGLDETVNALTESSKAFILEGSNGFAGNNQEIEDPLTSRGNSFVFKGEKNRAADLTSILDGKPGTWFEFERCLISQSDRNKAKNFNFEYKINKPPKKVSISPVNHPANWLWDSNQSDSDNRLINWAVGAPNGVLRLNLHVDIGALTKINLVTILPFTLTDNVNNPVKIKKVSVSANGTDWTPLNPENVWVASKISEKLSFVDSDKVVIGKAAWAVDGLEVRYIRFYIEQRHPIPCPIGHLYYLQDTEENRSSTQTTMELPPVTLDSLLYNTGIPYNNALPYGGLVGSGTVLPGSYSNAAINNGRPVSEIKVQQKTKLPDQDDRKKGPVPDAANPTVFYGPNARPPEKMIRKVEYFRGKRWVISVRDISVNSNTYQSTSYIISKKFNISGVVDRVSLEADVSIPENYPVVSDREEDYVQFYVSPDDGATWVRISRIQDDYLGIPEIVAFNDPTPVDIRLPGVGYCDVNATVNSLRLKVVLKRPMNDESTTSTPILKSYKLKVLKRV